MVATHRHRAALVAGVLLVSLLLFGCDFFDGFSESGGDRGAEKIREETQRDLQEAWEAQQSEGRDEGALTGEQDSPGTGPITAQEIAGTYSASATLASVRGDVESADSLPVTLQLDGAGSGTANVNGYGGAAQYAGGSVSFSVTMEEGGQSIVCAYKGTIARSEDDSQIAITGTMNCSMMGVIFASYDWTAYK